MEIFESEFGDMSPQELAAPVNTVVVSFEEIDWVERHDCTEASIMMASSREVQNL